MTARPFNSTPCPESVSAIANTSEPSISCRVKPSFTSPKTAHGPSSCTADPTRVKAVGTQFDVYRKADGTIVTVVEGRVAILAVREAEGDNGSTRHASEGYPSVLPGIDLAQREGEGVIFLGAGEQITVSPKIVRKTVHPNLAGATSWTQRQLVFDSASLADVAEELNRYNERKLVIDPSALGTLHISGVFSSTDPISLIRFLRDRPGLRVTETRTEIRVERDP